MDGDEAGGDGVDRGQNVAGNTAPMFAFLSEAGTMCVDEFDSHTDQYVSWRRQAQAETQGQVPSSGPTISIGVAHGPIQEDRYKRGNDGGCYPSPTCLPRPPSWRVTCPRRSISLFEVRRSGWLGGLVIPSASGPRTRWASRV